MTNPAKSTRSESAIRQAIAQEEKDLGRWEDLMMDDAAEVTRAVIVKLKAELTALQS